MASVDLHEKANFTRLSRLLVDKGTEALRTTLDAIHPPANLPAVLNANRTFLLKLKPRVINNSQWDLLFPPSGNPPDSKTFDVSLITILLRNVCGLHPPATGWNSMPPDTDNTLQANITRIKQFRNQVYAHVTTTQVDQTIFDDLWQKISQALFHMKISQKEIDDLKICPLGPDEEIYMQTLQKWALNDDDCKNMLADVQQQLFQSGLQQRDDRQVLNTSMQHLTQITEETHRGVQQLCHTSSKRNEKRRVTYNFEDMKALQKLAKHNFKSKIRNKVKLFHPGTRDWLLNEVEHWFTTESESRLLLITAGPGFGKSVFAAKVCEVFREKGKLAACHFCDFNDSNLKDPMIMLQSLASHMCENIAGFKDKLDDQVNRPHKVQSLKDSFQIYLQNPLDELEVEPSLIVIDGLDESATEDKSDMVKLIADYFVELPECVKVLITSRPGLSLQTLDNIQKIDIDDECEENDLDLLEYLKFFLPTLSARDDINPGLQSIRSYDSSGKVLPAIVKNCEGSFLYAFHVQRELSKRQDIDTMSLEEIMAFLPEGMGSVYQAYFHRLEVELETVMKKNPDLFKLLEVLVAADTPLPLKFLARALNLDFDCREMRKIINKVNEAVSCLLYVSDDLVTVFHKTVYDWLLSRCYEDHEYTVNVTDGIKRLWLLCEQVFEEIKRIVILGDDIKLTSDVIHALEYGHEYLLQCNMKDSFSWFVDMIIVHVLSTVYPKTPRYLGSGLAKILQSDEAISLPLRQRISWHLTEIRLLGKHSSLIESERKSESPYSYLETVLDHSPEDCFTDSEKKIAEILLAKNTRFLIRSSIGARPIKPLLSKQFQLPITAVGVSSSKKLAAVALEGGEICVLSLPNLVKLWQYSTKCKSISCCTFSSDDSFVLYGKLETVINTATKTEVTFFNGNKETFKSCAFSPNGKRLVTCDGSPSVKLWHVVTQSLMAVLRAGVPVNCCSFRSSGLFIVGNEKNASKGSYCAWNSITFNRVDQRILSVHSRKKKDAVVKSESCNRCLRKEPKEFIPFRGLRIIGFSQLNRFVPYRASLLLFNGETSAMKTFTGIYNNLDCIFYLYHRILRVIECKHFTVLAAWEIFMVDSGSYSGNVPFVDITPIEDSVWLYSDEEKLTVFGTILPVSRPTRVVWCSFSPDGFRLATCTSDGFINVWDVDVGRVCQRFQSNVETSSAACWWSDRYLFVCFLLDGVPNLSQYPLDNDLKIVISQGDTVSLYPAVHEFLPFSGILEFSEGYLILERGRRDPLKVLDVNEIEQPKFVVLPGIELVTSVVVSAGASFVLGSGIGFFLWKRDKPNSSVYKLFSSYKSEPLFPFFNQHSFECCFSSDSKFAVISFVSFFQRSFVVIDVDTGIKALDDINVEESVKRSQLIGIPKMFCTGRVILFLIPNLIQIFDLETWKRCGWSFQRNLSDDSVIQSKLSPKGNVLVVPTVTGSMEFFELHLPEPPHQVV